MKIFKILKNGQNAKKMVDSESARWEHSNEYGFTYIGHGHNGVPRNSSSLHFLHMFSINIYLKILINSI